MAGSDRAGRRWLGDEGPTRWRELLLVAAFLATLVVAFFPDVVFGGRTLSTSSFQWGVMGERPPYGYPETGEPPPPTLLRGGPDYNNYLSDPLATSTGSEPVAEKVSSSIRDLEFPLWARNMGLGRPFSLNLSKVLRLPVFLQPTPWMWDGFLLVRLVVAGLFTFLLARRLGIGRVGSSAAAVAFTFSGYLMLFINMPHVDFAMMVPVALYAMDLLAESPSGPRIGLAAVVLALGVLADNPRAAVVLVIFSAAYGVYRAASSKSGDVSLLRRRLLGVGLALGAGIGMTLWVFVPFLELTGGPGFAAEGGGRWTGRILGIDHAPGSRMISQIMPYLEGPPANSFRGDTTGVNNYTGAAVLLLAAMGVWNRRLMRGGGWFFLVAAGLMWAKMYGFPPVNWLGRLPILEAIRWGRYLPPAAALSLAVLAGMGVDSLARGMWRGRRVLYAVAALSGAFLLLLWVNRGTLGTLPRFHLLVQFLLVGAVVIGIVCVWLGVRLKVVSWGVAAVLMTGIVGGELMFHTLPVKKEVLPGKVRGLLERTGLDVINRPVRYDPYTDPPFISFLKEDASVYRIFGLDRLLYPNTALAYDLEDIRSFRPIQAPRFGQYVREFINPSLRARFTGAPFPPEDSEDRPPRISGNSMFDLLNVKYVLAREEGSELLDEEQFTLVHRSAAGRVYRNEHVLPRAFVVHDAVEADSLDAAVDRMKDPGFDPSSTAVVEGPLSSEHRAALHDASREDSTHVEIVSHRDRFVGLRVSTRSPGLLVLSDLYYPGWKAYVNGQVTRIYPTDVALRSLVLEPGDHEVAFVYDPGSFKVGAAISFAIASALFWAVVWGFLLRRSARRRSSTG